MAFLLPKSYEVLAVAVDIEVIDLACQVGAEFQYECFASIQGVFRDRNKLELLLAVNLQIDGVAIQSEVICPVYLLAEVSALERLKN